VTAGTPGGAAPGQDEESRKITFAEAAERGNWVQLEAAAPAGPQPAPGNAEVAYEQWIEHRDPADVGSMAGFVAGWQAAVAAASGWPLCPNGCGCRLGSVDADSRDCACDGLCCYDEIEVSEVFAERDRLRKLLADREPQPAPELETAFAEGMRVRTGPCTVHDREHFQVRTNRHWLCAHLLASMLAAQGIVVGVAPLPAPELAAAIADHAELEDAYAAAHGRVAELEAKLRETAVDNIALRELLDESTRILVDQAHGPEAVARAWKIREEAGLPS
jgi:hypothetical protein